MVVQVRGSPLLPSSSHVSTTTTSDDMYTDLPPRCEPPQAQRSDATILYVECAESGDEGGVAIATKHDNANDDHISHTHSSYRVRTALHRRRPKRRFIREINCTNVTWCHLSCPQRCATSPKHARRFQSLALAVAWLHAVSSASRARDRTALSNSWSRSRREVQAAPCVLHVATTRVRDGVASCPSF